MTCDRNLLVPLQTGFAPVFAAPVFAAVGAQPAIVSASASRAGLVARMPKPRAGDFLCM